MSLFVLLLTAGVAFSIEAAEISESAHLAQFEQTLFSHTFSNETSEQRLNRLEGVVYGQSQKGPIGLRTMRLMQVLDKHYAPVKITPAAFSKPKAPDATDYPTVSAMEQTVFHQTFSHQPIGQRLSQLEMQAFHVTSPRSAYVDRVDKLLDRYPNAVRMAQQAQLARERQGALHPEMTTAPIRHLAPIQMGPSLAMRHTNRPHRRVMMAKRSSSDDQQVQFGMGVTQAQSTRYSSEMMKMLPPDVQAKMRGESAPEPSPQRVPIAQPNPVTGPANLNPIQPQPLTPPHSTGYLGVPLN